MYFVLHTEDKKGIGDKDPRWAHVLEKDNTGFRGLTSFAPIPCRPASEERYSEGALLRQVKGERQPTERAWRDGPNVIKIVSETESRGDRTFHTAVKVRPCIRALVAPTHICIRLLRRPALPAPPHHRGMASPLPAPPHHRGMASPMRPA